MQVKFLNNIIMKLRFKDGVVVEQFIKGNNFWKTVSYCDVNNVEGLDIGRAFGILKQLNGGWEEI